MFLKINELRKSNGTGIIVRKPTEAFLVRIRFKQFPAVNRFVKNSTTDSVVSCVLRYVMFYFSQRIDDEERKES